MLILLPPSETKRSGGEGTPLSTTWNLSFPELDETRRSLVQSLCELAADPVEMISTLKLGPQQHDEVHVNAGILDAPTMPAIERFTGVLFDAIDVGTLDKPGRDFLASRILIQSALFGLVRASDFIPAYRLSFDSRLPSL
ncbi:peroxide stress protein YaaA, partial [bacterium]|nr:peroxide stress protein YaaA [bacterium]